MAQIRGYTGRIGGEMDVALTNAQKQGYNTAVLEALDDDGFNNHTFIVTTKGIGLQVTRVFAPSDFLKQFNATGRTG